METRKKFDMLQIPQLLFIRKLFKIFFSFFLGKKTQDSHGIKRTKSCCKAPFLHTEWMHFYITGIFFLLKINFLLPKLFFWKIFVSKKESWAKILSHFFFPFAFELLFGTLCTTQSRQKKAFQNSCSKKSRLKITDPTL